jgi:glucokinase
MLAVIINRAGEILARRLAPTPRGNQAVMDALLALVGEMLEIAGSLNARPSAIAIGIPGFVDTKNGHALDAENLAVRDLPVCKLVTEHYQLPACLYHDVRSAVLGEAVYGAGSGHPNFAFLNIGTGVAVGLYLDGKVYHGANHLAGEIGHMSLNPSATGDELEKSRLESLASGPALVSRARAALALEPHSLLHTYAAEEAGGLSPLSIQKAASAGDSLALRLIEETAAWLGAAVAVTQDILDLECVILGGGVAQMGDLLLKPLQAAVARYAILPVPVLVSPLGSDAGVIGVAATYFMAGG